MAITGDSNSNRRILRGDALGRISRLEFLARGVVEGFIAGRHQSPYKGTSIEFAEHRQYVPGDDLRALDWRVFGKSDRYYIKQYKEETNLRATILLDASGSMNYTGDQSALVDDHTVSKFEYAKYLAASMTYLLINQQDAVGLASFDDTVRDFIPPRSNARHMRELLNTIDRLETGGETQLGPIFDDVAERVHRRGLVIVISDLFGDLEPLLKSLHHFRYRRHEVVLMHVMAEEELTFPFEKWSDFRDLENRGVREELDPTAVRAEYLDRLREFVSGVEIVCGQLEIDYVPMNTRIPFDTALAGFLSSRRNLQK